jgi:adenine-specific DNA-methyltransferase
MDKLKMHSLNKVDDNITKIGKLFPNCLTERKNEKGEVEYAIDFDVLRQELSSVIVEGNEERYQFTWPDKKQSILLANAPIAKTLRPCPEESVDFDTTENLYIEGDNLDVLKLLQETYLGKVKMIYIDPPYNTGNDFVYEDDFAQSTDEYLANSGQFDEEGNRLVQNNESNGRFHTDWLNMIYPRVKVAKDLLSEDGVIFISIDDNEVENLKKICNEVFGKSFFAGQFPWRKRTAKSDVPFGISQDYEWLLCYTKPAFLACIEGKIRKYFETPDLPKRPWRIHDLTTQRSAAERPNSYFTMINPKTGDEFPCNINRTWAITGDTFEKYYSDKRIVFPGDYDFLNINKPAFRYFKDDDEKKVGEMFGYVAVSTNLPPEVGMSQDGTKDFGSLFENKLFSFPKPIELLKHFIEISTNFCKDALILDFFSGSATSAHAVMQLNSEDGGNRKFIMVQLPELTDEKSEAYKAGYKNICEIGKERIRRAGKKILEDQKAKDKGLFDEETPKLDIGFRVLKLDSTNMKDVYYNPSEYTPELFSSLTDNIKDDRTPKDLLFQVMLELGVLLSSKIEETDINGKKVFNVADGYLIACFDDDINDATVKAIAQLKPYYAVFRDSSMASDSVATNVEQIFVTYSPDTERKVL